MLVYGVALCSVFMVLTALRIKNSNTAVPCITTFWSMTDHIYDRVPIRFIIL